MNTFGSQVVATHLEDDVHHIICAADTVIAEIRDVLLKDNERLRDQVRRLLEVQGEQARDMMKEEKKREVTMEWKAMEIERLNDLLIKQANVIEKITAERNALKADVQNLCDENARLRADLQWMKEGRRPIQKEHFPPKDADREKER